MVKRKTSRFKGMSPWAWAIEPVHGCNLRCGHCATRLFPVGKTSYMTEATWRALFRVIHEVTPVCRVEMANAGEPTLHPELPRFIRIAKEISPHTQLQITTNGTMLASGKWTYRQLFNAGINIVYVDTYAPREQHIALAKESGFPWYEYHAKPPNAPGAWTYHGPDFQLIVLMDPPIHWPESRKKFGRLGTFLNNLDWEAAKEFNMSPVLQAPQRACNQPFRYVSVVWNGSYQLCCQDFMGETNGTFGGVQDGLEGFEKFWFGMLMQRIRRELRAKNRSGISQCARCNVTFSRCDVTWPESQLKFYWTGAEWKPLPPRDAVAINAAKNEEIITPWNKET